MYYHAMRNKEVISIFKFNQTDWHVFVWERSLDDVSSHTVPFRHYLLLFSVASNMPVLLISHYLFLFANYFKYAIYASPHISPIVTALCFKIRTNQKGAWWMMNFMAHWSHSQGLSKFYFIFVIMAWKLSNVLKYAREILESLWYCIVSKLILFVLSVEVNNIKSIFELLLVRGFNFSLSWKRNG